MMAKPKLTGQNAFIAEHARQAAQSARSNYLKGENMENIAVFELHCSSLRVSIYKTNNGKFKLLEEKSQPHKLGEEIMAEELMRPKTRNDILQLLKIYRQITQKYKVEKIYAYATNVLLKARNYRGFIEEVYNNTGISFSILSEEEFIKLVYTSTVVGIDSSKGIIINVNPYTTNVVKYNRRTILGSATVELGSVNLLTDEGGNARDYDQMLKVAKEQIKQSQISNFAEDDMPYVGSGSAFITFGRIAKKIARYPLDLDNGYEISDELVEKTATFIKGLDLEKVGKIKGIDEEDATAVLSSSALVQAFFEEFGIKKLTVSTANLRDGAVLTNVVLPIQEKFNDVLANSLENYYEFIQDEHSNNDDVYNMAAILFKQLKVMHKLPRFYLKPLRIASYMYDAGKNINISNYTKHGFDAILNSGIGGVTHRELLIASFICLCQNLDNFSLNEWIRYKDILMEEDLDAVRKLGVIVALANALNASRNNIIHDIACDILGDSIIMKTVVDSGVDASFEIMEGMKVAPSYRKVYKKSLQII